MMMKSAFVKSNVKLTTTMLIVLLLIESCETEPSCSSSITDSTNNFKNSELDEAGYEKV
jgi:major membrane immunogen (membrane-anchored lipoprotein)